MPHAETFQNCILGQSCQLAELGKVLNFELFLVHVMDFLHVKST